MSQIDDLNKFLAANPTTKAWVEEVLIRGGPADTPGWGVVKGAHFTIGLILQTPLGNSTPQIVGPFSAAEVPDGDATPFSQIVGVTVIQQQRAIDQQTAEIADLSKQLTDAQADAAAKAKQAEGLMAQIADLQAKLAQEQQ